MTEIDFALSQKEDTEVIELIGTVIWNKANKVKNFTALSLQERIFVYIDIFESELINGGLFNFFYNTSGAYAHEVLEAYETIGAHRSAQSMYSAITNFPEIPVPKDIFLRRSFMKKLDDSTTTKWITIEKDLLNSKEDIVTLLIDYVRHHKTIFEY